MEKGKELDLDFFQDEHWAVIWVPVTVLEWGENGLFFFPPSTFSWTDSIRNALLVHTSVVSME